jgi:ribosome maturation factor RimP
MIADPLLDPIRRLLSELGYELVDLRRGGTPARPVLRVRLDLPHSEPGRQVSADDCVRASRALERWLEGPGGLGQRYVLEVSSPGIERPVVFPEHWRRYAGREVRLRSTALPGRPVARIVAVPDEEHVALALGDGRQVTVPLADIREATLVVDWATIGKRQV